MYNNDDLDVRFENMQRELGLGIAPYAPLPINRMYAPNNPPYRASPLITLPNDGNGKRPQFLIISEYKQIVTIDRHIAVLPPVPTTTSFSTGNQHVQTVLYKDLNLNCVEEAFRDEEWSRNVDLFPLRNFLVGKKKGVDKTKRVFSVTASLNKTEQVGYELHLDRALLLKMNKTLENPSLTVQLKIEGVPEQSPGNQRGQRLASYETSERLTTKVSELLRFTNSGVLLFPRIGSIGDSYRAGQNRLTKEKLVQRSAQPSNKDLVFIWSVGVFVDDTPVSLQAQLKINSDSVLQALYGLEESKDLTILASNRAEIKCHRNILMVQSETFNSMLCPKNGMLEAQTGRIEMLENSADGLNQFIKFLYGFPIQKRSLGPDMAVELLQLSHKYMIKKMEEVLKDFLASKSMSWFTVDAVMELYFTVRNVQSLEELRAHALTEMSGLTRETLGSCDYYKKLPQEDTVSLLFTLLEWK